MRKAAKSRFKFSTNGIYATIEEIKKEFTLIFMRSRVVRREIMRVGKSERQKDNNE